MYHKFKKYDVVYVGDAVGIITKIDENGWYYVDDEYCRYGRYKARQLRFATKRELQIAMERLLRERHAEYGSRVVF